MAESAPIPRGLLHAPRRDVIEMDAPATGPRAAAAERADSPSGKSDAESIVLVIDDDPAAQELTARRLTAGGYRVIAEADGGAGLRRALMTRPVLVICDLLMPLSPGELVILALRASPETSRIPIVVLSVDPDRLGPEHDVDAMLTKPVNAFELLAIVNRLTAGGRDRGA